MADGNINFDTTFDSSSFQSGMRSINSQLNDMRGRLAGVAKTSGSTTGAMGKQMGSLKGSIMGVTKLIAGGFATIKLVEFSSKATSMAMDVESAIDNVNFVMKENSKVFKEWAESNASSFGIATNEAYKYGSIYGNLLSVFTKSTEETTDQTKQLMEATAVIASKTGRSFEDTASRIRSGMLGSTEAIEDLGIYTQVSMLQSTEAFKKFAGDKSWAKLDFQTQQQIRLAAILEQSYDRYGNTLANTTRTKHSIFIASLNNMKLAVGQAFLPIYDAVLPALTKMSEAMVIVLKQFTEFATTVFGNKANLDNPFEKSSDSLDKTVDGMNDLEKATINADKAAKKASKTVQGFDQLNKLGAEDNKSSSVDSSQPSKQVIKDGEKMKEDVGALSKTLDNIKKSAKEFYENFGVKSIVDGLKEGVETIDFNNLKDNSVSIIKDIMDISKGTVDSTQSMIKSTGEAIGEFGKYGIAIAGEIVTPISNAMANFFTNNKEDIIDTINEMNTKIENGMGNVKNIFDVLGESWLTSLQDYRGRLELAYEDLLKNLFNTGSTVGMVKIDIFEIVSGKMSEFFTTNEELIKEGTDSFVVLFVDALDLINHVWEDGLGLWDGFWEDWGKDMVGDLSEILTDLYEWMLHFWIDLLQPLLWEAIGGLKDIWDNTLSGLFEKLGEAIGKVGEVIKVLWDTIIKPIVDLFVKYVFPIIKDFVKIMIENVVNSFKVVGEIIGGLLDIIIGLSDFIVGVFTGDWTRAWEGIKTIFKGIFDSLVGIAKVPINLIIGFINGLVTGVYGGLNLISKLLNNFKFDIPDWVPKIGGNSLGFNIPELTAPKIPMLAKGGLIPPRKPRTVIVGDNNNEDEIVSPVSTMEKAVQNAILSMGGIGGNNQETNNLLKQLISVMTKGHVIELDGREFGRSVVNTVNNDRMRTGNSLL